MKSKISPNSVSLAGEFAVLSKLSLNGYEANMTLGNTKAVDILVLHPKTNKMFQLEVKTNYKSARKKPRSSKLFGLYESDWIMKKSHENIKTPNLFYCFVNIEKITNNIRFYIVPNLIVAKYIREEHAHWIKEKKKERKKVKDTDMRLFRIGFKGEKYSVRTPAVEKYENNWKFKK